MTAQVGPPCDGCGASNRPGARFCGTCGAALVAKTRCRSCGATNAAGQKFCDECGTPLEGSVEARPAPATNGLPRAYGNGRYEIIRFLGEGGRKRVYLARDARMQREVAVSAFKSDGADANALSGRLAGLTEGEAPWRYSALELVALAQLRAGDTEAARSTLEVLLDDPLTPANLARRAAELQASLGGPLATAEDAAATQDEQ